MPWVQTGDVSGTARIGVLTILDEEFSAAQERLAVVAEIQTTGCYGADDGGRETSC